MRFLKALRSSTPYLVAGFLLAWVVVNADNWDNDIATRDSQILQVWSYFILLTLACLGAIAKARDAGGP